MIIYDHVGRRAYTVEELNRIYVDTAREYFAAIEALLEYADSKLKEDKKHFQPMKQGYLDPLGHLKHAESETDSDGDGGSAPLLRGRGFIEFSMKAIPHGSLHFAEMLMWAGHILMHNTEAPEASHRIYIKKAMDRVRKGSDEETSGSMIDWIYRVHTWGKIIAVVLLKYLQAKIQAKNKKKPIRPQASSAAKKKRKLTRLQASSAAKKKRKPTRLKASSTPPKKKKLMLRVNFMPSKILEPNHSYIHGLVGETFSPLRAGGDNLIAPDARVSYNEVRQTYDSHI